MPPLNKTKKLRLRLDVYDASKRQYRPLVGQSLLIPVDTTRMRRPLWRGICEYVRSQKWKEKIVEDDLAPRRVGP